MSDAFAKIGFAPQCGCSPFSLKGRVEFEEPVRGIAFELLYDVRRSKDLFGMYEYMDMVGHNLHLSDGDAEGTAFFAHETLERMFNISIYQFLSVLGAPYQVKTDIVYAMY